MDRIESEEDEQSECNCYGVRSDGLRRLAHVDHMIDPLYAHPEGGRDQPRRHDVLSQHARQVALSKPGGVFIAVDDLQGVGRIRLE